MHAIQTDIRRPYCIKICFERAEDAENLIPTSTRPRFWLLQTIYGPHSLFYLRTSLRPMRAVHFSPHHVDLGSLAGKSRVPPWTAGSAPRTSHAGSWRSGVEEDGAALHGESFLTRDLELFSSGFDFLQDTRYPQTSPRSTD